MATNSEFFDLIKELSIQIKQYPIGNIIAKRVYGDEYDETFDYSNHKFLCMFHNDSHSGNFDISKGNRFTCWVCGESGDAVTFVMKFENKTFPEAVIELAYELEIIDEKLYKKLSKGESISGATYNKTEIKQKAKQNDIASVDDLDYVYRLFLQGNTWIKKPKLKKHHLEHLMFTRKESLEEIEEVGYCSYPSIYVLKHIIKQMKKDGKDVNLLLHIPGFFYDEKKEKISFMLLKNNDGICIPIKNTEGKIVGIQIRLDSVAKGDLRYIWFSSSFATKNQMSGGTSPGTPIDVHYPRMIKHPSELINLESQTIFITEGHFKAKVLAKTFNTVALSVQGVHNWRNIPYVLDKLKQYNSNFKHVYIMYDADMSYKESVLQPAIKMGLSLTNLDFKGLVNSVEDILSVNRKHKNPLRDLKNKFIKVDDYLRLNAGIFKFNIVYCWWDPDTGKGIDDYLESFSDVSVATSFIKKIQLISFWEKAYHYLLLNEVEKEAISLREGIENLDEIVLDEEIKKNNFYKVLGD